MINQLTTNPDQLNDRATAIQIAQQLDEANCLAVALYTVAGAIVGFGKAFLKTGTAGAFTLAQPTPGSQLNSGNDGATLIITALDAEAYTVTTAASGIIGASHVITFGAAIGDSVMLIAYNGVWYVVSFNGSSLTS